MANTVFAVNYSDSLWSSSSNYERISATTLWEAALLQTYVLRYRDNTSDLYNSYSSDESTVMKWANKTLTEMSKALTKIQNESLDPTTAKKVMKEIVWDLKTLNIKMKIYLGQERDKYDRELLNKKFQYEKIASQISKILDELINGHTKKLINIEVLSSNQKKLVQILVAIQKENTKVKDFKNIVFKNEAEMKNYFKNIIENLRRDIKSMKNYL